LVFHFYNTTINNKLNAPNAIPAQLLKVVTQFSLANLKQRLVDKENLEESISEAQTQIEIKEKEIDDLNSGIEDTKQEIEEIELYFNQFNDFLAFLSIF